MPLLEKRRRPPADPALRCRGLTPALFIFLRQAARNWPLSWVLIYLAGFGLGGRLPAGEIIGTVDHRMFPLAARTAALLPAWLAVVPVAGALPVWLGVGACGLAAGSLEAGQRQGRTAAVAADPCSPARPLTWSGPAILRITGWSAPAGKDRWRAPSRILHLGNPREGPADLHPLSGQGVQVSGDGDPPRPGAVLTGLLSLSVPPAASLPGAFDYRLFLAGRGLRWQGRLAESRPLPAPDVVERLGARVFAPLYSEIVAGINRLLPAPEAQMAGAVLLGRRDSGSRAASRPFADLGLAHLFAVSGLHVGILLGIIVLPGQWAGFSPGQRLIPVALLLPLYVLLTGMPGSVMRAASLGFLALLAAALGKPVQSLRLLGLLFWAGTVWDPVQNLDAGLKLSYLAAGGILAVSALSNGLRFAGSRILGPVFTGLAVSAAAQWFTLPLVAGSFGRLSALSLPANLVAVPLFGLAVWCVVLGLLSATVWPGGAESAGALAWLLFRSLAGMAGSLSKGTAGFPIGLPPPGLGRIMIWMVLSAAGLVSLKRFLQNRISGVATLVFNIVILAAGLYIFGPLSWSLGSPGKVTAWQFDVGQGDCALVVLPDGWSLLIDTAGNYGTGGGGSEGPLTRTVLPFLQRNGLTRLDGVVLTHGHLDHTGGARALEEALEVGTWYLSGKAGRTLADVADSTRIVRPCAGRVLHRWREWEVAVAFPPGPLPEDWDENDHSLVVVLRRLGKDLAVWSGDLEREGEQLLVAGGEGPTGIQVWKAGHHGSNTSGSPAMLQMLDPQLILISCGVGNRYGHPSHGAYVVRGDTLPVARTDLQGSIRLEWDLRGGLTWRSMATGSRSIALP